MPYAILRICDRFMDARRSTSWCGGCGPSVCQLVYFVAEQDKVRALLELTGQFNIDRLLVFRHTQIGVDKLALTLKRRGQNGRRHGGMSQRDRTRTLADFKSGKIRFLVATNVASRGLDITDLPFVSLRHPGGRRYLRSPRGSHGPSRQGGHRHHLRRRVGSGRPGPDPRRGRRR